MGLAPGRTLRLRRKSKDLEAQATAIMADKLEAVFKAVDADGNGYLEPDELKVAFEKAGLPASDDQIKQSIKALDTNNDGKIDLEEYVSRLLGPLGRARTDVKCACFANHVATFPPSSAAQVQGDRLEEQRFLLVALRSAPPTLQRQGERGVAGGAPRPGPSYHACFYEVHTRSTP